MCLCLSSFEDNRNVCSEVYFFFFGPTPTIKKWYSDCVSDSLYRNAFLIDTVKTLKKAQYLVIQQLPFFGVGWRYISHSFYMCPTPLVQFLSFFSYCFDDIKSNIFFLKQHHPHRAVWTKPFSPLPPPPPKEIQICILALG